MQGQLYCTSHFVTIECGNYASDWKQLTELFNPAEFQWHISNRYAHCSCTWSAGASVARIEKVAWCTAFQSQPVQGACKDWQDAHAGKRLGSSASRTHELRVLRVSRVRMYFARPCPSSKLESTRLLSSEKQPLGKIFSLMSSKWQYQLRFHRLWENEMKDT